MTLPSSRRKFLQTAGAVSALAPLAEAASAGVSIVLDPTDPVASSGPARWAARELELALAATGLSVQRCERIAGAKPINRCIISAGSRSDVGRRILASARVSIAAKPEALGIVPASFASRPVLLATGNDIRGLVFALLELADSVRNEGNLAKSLSSPAAIVETPANAIRAVTRLFTSDVEDKPWFNDREMWPPYLTMLATHRFNRFNLALGIGYDFIRNVTDAYFLFPYPFLMEVPGYNVRVPQLANAERDQNLKMLRYISEQTVARGLEFQLGLWMHGYEWIDSPKPNYTIEGIDRQNHGPYCRDAVRLLLQTCPAISGVTFRVHGESGVEEGSYEFWKTVFDGVATCGRKVEIDMHAKGMDETMQNMAVATKQPVKISPKYWAEHMGMPYHQADIRELEQPKPGRTATGLMKFSAGSRSFLRYGYGDLLREDRPWGVIHRIWPGTQRILLWADPLTAAAHSRAFQFCGSDGVEIMEPLSFKGRRGSGIAGDRCAYLDTSLKPRWDWQKYEFSHRVWGRLLFNPDSDLKFYHRAFTHQFGPGAPSLEAALANASRILPIITTAHGASAGNNSYWPEVYLNQSMIDAAHFAPYSDTPSPRVFGNVSPLDPQLFSRINDFADQLLKGEVSGKYSPIEVAQWLEDYAEQAVMHLAKAETMALRKDSAEYRRISIDVSIQAGLGKFFGAKFRSGVLYRIYERTGNRTALEEAIRTYRAARSSWAELANLAKGVYKSDITVGEHPQLRGHWSDRLPAMDADIALVAKKLDEPGVGDIPAERAAAAIRAALERPRRSAAICRHQPVATFQPGQPLMLELTVEKGQRQIAAKVHYRHVTQAERYESVEMEVRDGKYRAAIPGSYTDTKYPLEYYFELTEAPGKGWLYPGFNAELTNQPYFVVRRG